MNIPFRFRPPSLIRLCCVLVHLTVEMRNDDIATATTALKFTDALKSGRCLTCKNHAEPFLNNATNIATSVDNNNIAVALLAATYPSYRYYRPSCPSLALSGVVSGGVMGATFGGAMAISSGVGRHGVLQSAGRNAIGFGLWTGTFRGTRCLFARSGIPGFDGVLGATAAGAATGAGLTIALSGFNMHIARPAIARNAAGSALIAGVFSLLSSV